ncbi:MAG: hypothetical protein FWD26_07180 [Treponema sp.]|nr:hypothetical protein [Treponema sp.]
MTLSERNIFFKTGIFFCAAIILLILAASFFTVLSPAYPQPEEGTLRPAYIFNVITGKFLKSSYYAVYAGLALAALFSFAGILLIHSFFERTPAPEILYIAFFTISFSFEALRLFLPLHLIYHFPSFYLRIAARVLFFARFFGIFALFTAGLYAAGLDVQKTRNAIFTITIATLAITLSVPIDVHSWDTSFNYTSGYKTMFKMIEILVFLTAMISFFIAAKVRDSREYVNAAVGVIFIMVGRNILLGTDNWIGAVQGVILLSLGTWYLCSKIHKIHLWL